MVLNTGDITVVTLPPLDVVGVQRGSELVLVGSGVVSKSWAV